jgi:hypothetical protein
MSKRPVPSKAIPVGKELLGTVLRNVHVADFMHTLR